MPDDQRTLQFLMSCRRRAHTKIRRSDRRRSSHAHDQSGRDFRPDRAQRLGQEHAHQDADDIAAADLRLRDGRRLRHRQPAGRGAASHRLRPAAPVGRRLAHRLRKHAAVGAALWRSPIGTDRAHHGALARMGLSGVGASSGRTLFRRHDPAAGDRPEPSASPDRAVSRRAHGGARPRRPRDRLGACARSPRPVQPDHDRDIASHGRNQRVLRPHRAHRSRPDRRRRHARRIEGTRRPRCHARRRLHRAGGGDAAKPKPREAMAKSGEPGGPPASMADRSIGQALADYATQAFAVVAAPRCRSSITIPSSCSPARSSRCCG